MILPALSIPLIPPTDPRIVTIGRFDRTDPNYLACQWSASEVRLRVNGGSLVVTLEELGKDLWQIVVDEKPRAVLAPHADLGEYRIDLGGSGIHDVRLIKRTEPFVGTTRFRGFQAPGGLFQARRKARLIEFIGDSITCGYGNEGASEKEHFAAETENVYQSYAMQAARALDADVRILAWSGRKMWPENTMPEIYDRILPTQASPVVESNEPVATAIVVALATNDFAQSNPNETGWTQAYEEFLRRARSRAPEAQVYVALGGMMTDDWPPKTKALSNARGYLTRMVQRLHDPKVHFIEFDQQRAEDKIGSDWHPSVATHRKMAAKLVEAIKKDLEL